MSTAYHNNGQTSPSSFLARLPPEMARWLGGDRHTYSNVSTGQKRRGGWNWNWKALFKLPHLFIAVWVLVLWWGERWVFWNAVRECEWDRWERWVRYHSSYCGIEDIQELTFVQIAQRCNPPPPHLHRGPPAHRPALVPESSLICSESDDSTYGQLYEAQLHCAAETAASGYGVFSWGSV